MNRLAANCSGLGSSVHLPATSPTLPIARSSRQCLKWLAPCSQGTCTSRTPRCVAIPVAEPALDEPAIAAFPAPLPGTFSPQRDSFSEEHQIRGYEVLPNQRATIVTIANLLQEIAGNHAVGMWGRTENGFANMPSMKDLIFVMTRLQIRMHEYPKWGDMVKLETYFSAEGRLAARRDWRILDSGSGKVLGGGTSTWVTINTATRKLSKLPDDLRGRFLRYSPKQPRHSIPVGDTKRKLPDFEEDKQVLGPQQVARRSDVDMNGHINNVTYLAWALEAVPEDVYASHQVYEVEVDFKAECGAGELIQGAVVALPSVTANGSGVARQFLHSLQKCDDAGVCQELVRCRSTWVPCRQSWQQWEQQQQQQHMAQ